METIEPIKLHDSTSEWFRIDLFAFQLLFNSLYSCYTSMLIMDLTIIENHFANGVLIGVSIGVVAGWIADSYIQKFKLHTIFLTCTFIVSVISLVLATDYKQNPKRFHICFKYEYILFFTWRPLAYTFYFEQVAYKKTEFGLNTPTFLWVWTSYVTHSVFGALYGIIMRYFNYRILCFCVSLTTTIILSVLTIVTLLFARWGFKPPVFFNLPCTTLLYGAYTCESRLREKFGVETVSRRDPRKYQPNVQFMCKRYWAVTVLGLFAAFYGHMEVLASVTFTMLSIFLFGHTSSTIYNFHSYFSWSTAILFPIYYYCAKRCKCFSNDLGLIGLGKVFIVISLSYLTGINMVMEFHETPQPENDYAQIRIFNILDSPTDVISSLSNVVIEPISYAIFSRIKTKIHGLETTMEISNPKHGIHQTTSVDLVNGLSLCYYVGNEGITMAGVEPLPTKLQGILGRGMAPQAYFVSQDKDAELSVRYKDGRVIQIPRINTTAINSADIFQGKFDVLVKTQGKTRVHFSNFESFEDSIYAILLFDPTSTSGIKIFTVKNPRIMPVQTLIPSAALFGLGSAIVRFHASKFVITEVPPPLRSIFISTLLFVEKLPDFSFFTETYLLFVSDLKRLHINITIILIFLLLYGSLAMRHRPYTFTTYSSDVEPENLPERKMSIRELKNVMRRLSESTKMRRSIDKF